jgi:hypothetical protein
MKKKKRKEKAIGVCKLVKKNGVFVDSHIIPKALTKPSQKGAPLVQHGIGLRPKRRWSSWFDPMLVTNEGEKILAELDTWAIREFRKHKLVWSSWGGSNSLGDLHTPIEDSPWGIRKIGGIDPIKIRLFFLSLLWRAAQTSLHEFKEINIPAEDIERIRKMLCGESLEPISFYPIQLTQLSTIGVIHNYTPISDLKVIKGIGGSKDIAIPIYRFYFDGLIAHFHLQSSDSGLTSRLGNLIVGAEKSLILTTQTYDFSLQKEHFTEIIRSYNDLQK